MNIALLSRFRGPFGGAERSLFRLAEQLSADHDVTLYYLYDGDHSHAVETEQLPNRLWGDRIDERVPFPYEAVCLLNLTGTWSLGSVLDPSLDLVVSQHEGVAIGAQMHREHDCPHFVWLHDDFLTVPADRSVDGPADAVRRLIDVPRKRVLERLYAHTTGVLANSQYTANQLQASTTVTPDVLYPFIDAENVRSGADAPGSYVLHVAASYRKGADVTLEVARRLPDEQFVLVGRNDEEIVSEAETIDNVRYEGWVDSMADAYADAKLVLMPSRWPEPFGMVPVEAGLNGVPTVGSDRGGLSEAIGIDECVVSSNAASEYVSKLRRVLADRERFADRAYQHATKFLQESQYEQFESIVESHGVELG